MHITQLYEAIFLESRVAQIKIQHRRRLFKTAHGFIPTLGTKGMESRTVPNATCHDNFRKTYTINRLTFPIDS
jgi:hypothetical protein